jgi:ribosome maturation factor RimP
MLCSIESFRAGVETPVVVPRVGARPLFLRKDPDERQTMTPLQTDIERRIAQSEPDVEVLLAEVLGGRCLRVFIDHPEGVTLALCERVTALLSEERERYSLEVSSPGSERPLSKPAHFRRFVGRRARVRTRHPRPVGHAADQCSAAAKKLTDQRSGAPTSKTAVSFTGELVGASEDEITLAAEEGIIAIPYSEIRRSNLVEE